MNALKEIVSLRSPARPQFTAEFLRDFKSFEPMREGGHCGRHVSPFIKNLIIPFPEHLPCARYCIQQFIHGIISNFHNQPRKMGSITIITQIRKYLFVFIE